VCKLYRCSEEWCRGCSSLSLPRAKMNWLWKRKAPSTGWKRLTLYMCSEDSSHRLTWTHGFTLWPKDNRNLISRSYTGQYTCITSQQLIRILSMHRPNSLSHADSWVYTLYMYQGALCHSDNLNTFKLIDCLIACLLDWLADCLTDWVTEWLTDWLIDWLIDWLNE